MKMGFFILLLLTAGVSSCNNKSDIPPENKTDKSTADTTSHNAISPSDTSRTVNENIAEHSELQTLTSAIETAELITTLSGAGPITIFAPSDSAFKSSGIAVKDLEKSGPDKQLQKRLTYHMVSGAYRTTDLKNGMEITTVHGGKIRIAVKDGKYEINGSTILAPNLISKNGVVHVIDKVLTPGP